MGEFLGISRLLTRSLFNEFWWLYYLYSVVLFEYNVPQGIILLHILQL